MEELEAHVTWGGESGLDLFAIRFSETLTTIDLTVLEGDSSVSTTVMPFQSS